MKARGVMYATLFTAGVEWLAIFSAQDGASSKILRTQTALAAPAPTAPGVQMPITATFLEPTRLAQEAKKPPATVATANAARKLNTTRRLYDSMVPQYRMGRQHQVVRRPRKWEASYAWSQPGAFSSGRNY